MEYPDIFAGAILSSGATFAQAYQLEALLGISIRNYYVIRAPRVPVKAGPIDRPILSVYTLIYTIGSRRGETQVRSNEDQGELKILLSSHLSLIVLL